MSTPTDHPYLNAQLQEQRAHQRRWREALANRYEGRHSWDVRAPDLDEQGAAAAESILRSWIHRALEDTNLAEVIEQIVAAREGQLGMRLFNESSLDAQYPESGIAAKLESFAVGEGAGSSTGHRAPRRPNQPQPRVPQPRAVCR